MEDSPQLKNNDSTKTKNRNKRKEKSSSNSSSEPTPQPKRTMSSTDSLETEVKGQLSHITQRLDNMFNEPSFINSVKSIFDNAIQGFMQHVVGKMEERCERLESSVFDLEQVNDKLTTEINTMKKSDSIKTELPSINRDILHVLQKSNDNEQYSRLEAIRIYGVPESPREDCRHVFCDIFRHKLGLSINPSDINKIHRLDRRINAGNNPRPIILRFFAHAHKREYILNRKKLKNTGIIIAEDLTQTNFQVINRAQNNENVSNAWSTEGKIFVKLRDRTKLRIHAYANIGAMPLFRRFLLRRFIVPKVHCSEDSLVRRFVGPKVR